MLAKTAERRTDDGGLWELQRTGDRQHSLGVYDGGRAAHWELQRTGDERRIGNFNGQEIEKPASGVFLLKYGYQVDMIWI